MSSRKTSDLIIFLLFYFCYLVQQIQAFLIVLYHQHVPLKHMFLFATIYLDTIDFFQVA